MARTFSVSGSVVIAAEASAIYDQVSDPRRMGEWSPENLGATLRDAGGSADTSGVSGGDGGAVVRTGTVFDGRNKRGAFRWTTRCTVTAAEPGTRFAFRVHAIGLRRPRLPGPIATWEYRFEPAEGGTRVTETWTDDRRRWPDALANAFDRVATRGHTFADFQRGNIRRTLDNLKAAMERTGPGAR
ncbi:SRPBCC family protein [Streptomyces sp. NPDC054796]